jgi:hypothetical protein
MEVFINGERYTECPECHVHSIINELELDGYAVELIHWHDDGVTVYVTTGEDEES